MLKLKKIIILSCLILSACQNAEEASKATPPVKNPTATEQTTYRYDHSPIQSVDTQILRSAATNRSIPGLDDSNVTYCESVNGESGQYNGVRDTKRYPLASLSKIFLSAWALDKLGPNYQFENLWYLKNVSAGVYDVYFRANYDPALNIEKMLYAMSMLRAQGVQKIRQLVIDETTRVYLSVMLDPHVELEEVPVGMDKSIENLQIILNSNRWGPQTERAKAHLIQRNITVPSSFSVDQVTYVESKKINLKNYVSTVTINSSPLLKYLKDINVNSNNYMADMLFKILGGSNEFKKFQQLRLHLSTEDLQFYTGSGLAINSLDVRVDNTANCVSVLKTLKFIYGLSVQLNFNMGHVLLTAGMDQGTYESNQSLAFHQSVALKTGRLYDVVALNVAGTAALENGTLFFAYMAHHFDNDDEAIYKNKRDSILNSILNYYPTTSSYETMVLDDVLF